MSTIRAVGFLLCVSAGIFSAALRAGEVAVVWQDPEKYADVETDDLDQQAFQAKLFRTLESAFREQAGGLPEGGKLAVTVTDLDLAGERRISNDGDYQRVVKEGYFPKMTLDYTLTDAAGTVQSQRQAMEFRDLGFFDASSSMRANQSPHAFYYETEMIRHWFRDTLGGVK